LNKKFPIIILSIILVGLGIYLLTKPNFSNIKIVNQPFDENKFKWGVSLNAYPNGVKNKEILDKVLGSASDLGTRFLRIETSPNSKYIKQSLPDEVVDEATKKGFQVVLSFMPDGDFSDLNNPYQSGYDEAYKIASFYSKVNYFQLGNEPATGALKKNWSGANEDSFDKAKYAKVLEWLRGASDGIKKANGNAKRIITGNWLNVSFFEMLVRDGINFDIVGWDWFNEEKDFTTIKPNEGNLTLLERLNNLNKEIWMMEVGISGTDENKQADYLEKFINKIQNIPTIKGLFVGVLYDQVHLVGTSGQYDGIVRISKTKSGDWVLEDPKLAYDLYQKIIRESSK